MKSSVSLLHLPLLWKELLEESGRKRTYIIRVGYLALLAFLVSGYLYRDLPQGVFDSRALLGIGTHIFDFVMKLQFFTIFLLLPLVMSGAIAGEKERGSLELLLMTNLGAWRILIQKYAGSLILIFSFLLMGLPLMMVAYAFGGVTDKNIVGGIYGLVMTALLVGAICIMFSARSRNTLKALRDSFLVGGIAVAVIPFLNGYWLFKEFSNGNFENVAVYSVVQFMAMGFCLFQARKLLEKRAFEHAGEEAREIRRQARNEPGIWGRNRLKVYQPILWREESKTTGWDRSFQIGRHLPVYIVGIIIWLALTSRAFHQGPLVLIIWMLIALAVLPRLAGKLAEERGDRTFDLLLTTPLSGRSILFQKTIVYTKQLKMLGITLLIIHIAEALTWKPTAKVHVSVWLYIIAALGSAILYVYLFKWLSIFIGFKARSRLQAIITVVFVLVGWCAVLPLMVTAVWGFAAGGTDPPGFLLIFTSPAVIPWALETRRLGLLTGNPVFLVFANFLVYEALLIFIRYHCIKHVNKYLGRI